jgi:hypothetical protein
VGDRYSRLFPICTVLRRSRCGVFSCHTNIPRPCQAISLSRTSESGPVGSSSINEYSRAEITQSLASYLVKISSPGILELKDTDVENFTRMHSESIIAYIDILDNVSFDNFSEVINSFGPSFAFGRVSYLSTVDILPTSLVISTSFGKNITVINRRFDILPTIEDVTRQLATSIPELDETLFSNYMDVS